jgi:DNA-binding transcriptional ArsR family regulator
MKNCRRTRRFEDELYQRRAWICRTFAYPVRLKIRDLICWCACPISQLHRQLGISGAKLSQHLAILKAAGMVATRWTEQHTYCYVAISETKKACTLIINALRAQIRT